MTTDAVSRVVDLVANETGITLTLAQRGSLVAAIGRVAPGMTATRLLSEGRPSETLERLIDEITVRETFFFRHRAELDTIDWHGALHAARARGSDAVHVWTAGCASGEEAYTIAILACEAFGSASPPVRILATDIAPTALAQATRGRYGARAVRTLDEAVRQRYFTTNERTLCVRSSLRALVEVRRHNLVRDSVPPIGAAPFDLILCRNVLIYFDRATVDRVVASLEGALWPGGRLLLGAADRLSGQPRRTPPAPARATTRRGTGARIPAPTGAAEPPADRSPSPPAAPRPALGRSGRPALGSFGRPALGSFGRPAATGASPTHHDARRERLAEAMRAADRGDLELALQITGEALVVDPLDAEAYFIMGVAELACERPQAAVGSLRRALYMDPTSGLIAFKLARAHDSLGELGQARRAYEQALRTLELDVTERPVAETRDRAEITTACRARLKALARQP